MIMRHRLLCALFTGVLFLVAAGPARADDVADRQARRVWLEGYKTFAKAKAAEGRAPKQAREFYALALKTFLQVRTEYPEWNPASLELRINACRRKLAQLAPKTKPEAAAEPSRDELAEKIRALTLALARAKRQAETGSAALKKLEEMLLEQQRLKLENESLRRQLNDVKETGFDPDDERAKALAALDALRQEHEEAMDAANKTLKQQSKTIDDLRSSLRRLSLRDLKRQRQLQKHNRLLERFEAEIKKQQDERAEAEAKRREFKEKLETAKELRLAAEKSKDELTKALREVKVGDTKQMKEKIAAQQIALEMARVEIVNYRLQVARLKARSKSLTQDLDVLQTANGELRLQLKKLQAEGYEELAKELKATADELHAGQLDMQERYGRLQQRYQDQLDISRALKNKLLATPTTDEALRRENARLKKELAQNVEKIKLLQARLIAGRVDQERAVKQAQVDRRLLAELNRKHEALKTEMENVRARIKEQVEDETLQQKVEKLVQRAHALEDAEKLTQARGAYEQVLALNPDHFDALLRLGKLQADAEQLLDAERRLRHACRLRPQAYDAVLACGHVLLRADKPREAVGVFAQAARLRPQQLEPRRSLGMALQAAKWHQAAERELLAVWRLDESSPATALALAWLYVDWRPPRRKAAASWYSKSRKLGLPADRPLERLLSGRKPEQ